MVRADQIPSLVPPAAGRAAAGHGGEPDLRRSRLLIDLRAKARELGFEGCRIAAPALPAGARENLAAWLAAGAHGDMNWMAETFERRADPKVLWPQARSVVMLAMNYGPAVDPLEALRHRSCGAISVYARHRDYHDVIKGRLKTLAAWLVAAARPEKAEVKVFVDTAPVMEKPLAAAAGLGWQGKHTNLVSRDFGSWLFLGAIFTDLALRPDAPESDHCGACRACLDVCPTRAFTAPYRLDARRCVSYLTIEHKGTIAPDLRPAIGARIYGCDDCLTVCPWNKFAREGREAKLVAREDLANPPLAELAGLDEPGFRRRFAGGPIKRIGHARFQRNVMIAIGNSRDPALIGAAQAQLAAPSPLVRAMAVWALARLCPVEEFSGLAREYAEAERDADVAREWRAPIAAPPER
ncbi:MAG TPA: tRNA epoxyqueuosine(34) reductase QueG [Roseiarcus sp.]|nr:tRNA epoxyqueuosine(34) reductase QueG [Roseiarcus sp.]